MLLTVLCLQNNPLYLEAFDSATEAETLQFHHIVHCSLDAVEEKCRVRIINPKSFWQISQISRLSFGALLSSLNMAKTAGKTPEQN